jgi:organic radical activating enzyme
MEMFYTVQGEGFNTGKSAFFVRLGGCDVGCRWCDVKDSWDASKHPQMSIDEITGEILKSGTVNIVITGGEPLMYDLSILTSHLKRLGFNIWLETSGAYPLSGEWDWIVYSPKKFKRPLEEVAYSSDELKIIVYNKHDFVWAEEHATLVGEVCELYLQPEWGREKEMLPLIIDYVKKNPKWRISLQTHKYMNIP